MCRFINYMYIPYFFMYHKSSCFDDIIVHIAYRI